MLQFTGIELHSTDSSATISRYKAASPPGIEIAPFPVLRYDPDMTYNVFGETLNFTQL